MPEVEQKPKDEFFNFLRGADLNLTPRSIHAQVDNLTQLANALYEIARTEGGIGYSAFHHANVLAQSVDYAIGNLRRIGELNRLLEEWSDGLK